MSSFKILVSVKEKKKKKMVEADSGPPQIFGKFKVAVYPL